MYPFDTVTWERRTAAIYNSKGEAVFEQKDVEFPSTWSQLATNVVASKYFYGDLAAGNGDPREGKREYSLKQLIHRVTRTIADWGKAQGYFATPEDAERFYDELTWLCLHQYGAFNSPVWFNVGLYHQYGVRDTGGKTIYGWDFEKQRVVPVDPYERPQASACFIISVETRSTTSGSSWPKAPACSSSVRAWAPTGPSCARRRRSFRAAAGLRVRFRSCACRTPRAHDQVGREDAPGRHHADAEGLAPRHHGVRHGQG